MATLPSILQNVGGASTVVAPTTFTLTVPATAAGSSLVLIFAAAVSAGGAGFSLPGWTFIHGSNSTTIASWQYWFPNTAAGVTTVAFTAMTNINGFAIQYWEIANAGILNGLNNGQTVNNGATSSAASPAKTPLLANEIWFGGVANITGSAVTLANQPSTGLATWTPYTAQTSTNGATNIVLQGFSSLMSYGFPNTNMQTGASFAPNASNAASILSLYGPAAQTLTGVADAGMFGYLAGGQFVGAIGG